MIQTFPSVAGLRNVCDEVRRAGGTVGFVPTMGALHAGHLALVRAAKAHTSFVVVSIFVNPTQFGPHEDFERYPRQLERDVAQCEAAGASAVFAPSTQEMYPEGEVTRVVVGGLTSGLCGAFRPGHFEGVATVVTKLFAAVGPCTAVFGRKDYQQLKVIERMVRDLILPVQIVGHPTLRDPDGLAMSSRNAYLSPSERERALAIPRALSMLLERHQRGERQVSALEDALRAGLGPLDTVQYACVVDADTLMPPTDGAIGDRALAAVAGKVGATRLIDNVVLGEDVLPLGERAS